MQNKALNFDTALLYAIRVGNSDGIPAVEQDMSDGSYHILVFTSEEKAKHYCHLRCPSQAKYIYQMEKRDHNGKPVQTGLIRVSRKCLSSYKNISGVIFDHPGIHGVDTFFATMNEVATSFRVIKPKQTVMQELTSSLEKADKGGDI